MMPFPYQIKSLEQYHQVYRQSVENPQQFWSDIASHFVWKKKFDQVLNWNFTEPKIEWFVGATLNITENCLARWASVQPNSPAIIWEANNPEEQSIIISYQELLQKVNQFCHVLKNNGAQKGDRICIYMPMVLELAIAVLACARIGAIHSVVFGGFSAQSIADRINDASCNMVITADGAFRGNKQIPLKGIMDEALPDCKTINKVIVLNRTNTECVMQTDRDVWWHQEIEKVEALGNPFFEAESMEAEDPLFILYTSGSTGKPKGVVHTCAGYMVYTNYSFVNVFQYQQGDVHFCTADIGWITGHSYIIYGPLSAGATTLLFEGIPTWPDAGRFWEVVEKHKVNILYTAPTAIRSLMSFGLDFVKNKNLQSLKILGSVGEPINEEAWHWYHTNIGKGNCPIVDTWWQTETGGILISNLAGVTPHKPAHATLPLPGIQAILVDENGLEIKGSNAANFELPQQTISGNLCIQFPWPGMLRTTWGNHDRCKQTYFSTYSNLYFTGDGCLRDTEGNYRITGRVDDVLNVSGHRIGTAELENAINQHPGVVESAIVGFPHDIKGQAIYAFVIFSEEVNNADVLNKAINATVTKLIGAIAKPDKIQFVLGLPKTRSGKIMRRILRKIAEGETENLGDVSTLLDPTIVEDIVKGSL
jgi:acetyl-CoA synthetase